MQREVISTVRNRFLTWPVWTGFLLCVVALFSYPFFFVRFPITRDFPWVNLVLYCVAGALIVVGLQRSFGIAGKRTSRIVGSILTVFSALVFALFIFVAFVFPRHLPGLELAPALNRNFNRLPWLQRASPSATLHETVVSTDADRLM